MSDIESSVINTPLPSDPVADAMGNLVNVLKQNAMDSMDDADAFMRNAEYMRSVMQLRTAWIGDLPAAGKARGKPGRKPRPAGAEATSTGATANESGLFAEGASEAEGGTGEGEAGEGENTGTADAVSADAAPTSTQHDAPATPRSSGRGGRRGQSDAAE